MTCSICSKEDVIAYTDVYGINYCLCCAVEKCEALEQESRAKANEIGNEVFK